MKPILDPCCGSRMMWFDRTNPDVIFGDQRRETLTLTDRSHGRADGTRALVIDPDVLLDFRALPYADNSFRLVAFDPPHLVRAGPRSWLAAKYGKLGADWRADLRQGFSECFRVLDPGGVLVFKWNETQVKVREVLALAPMPPPFWQHLRQESWHALARVHEAIASRRSSPSNIPVDYPGGLTTMPIPLTPAEVSRREALIRQHYPTGNLQQLAHELGVNLRSLQARASELGVHRAQSDHTRLIIELLLRLAEQPRGTSIPDAVRQAAHLPNVTRSAIESAVVRMIKRGDLHKATISHRHVRLCRTAETAQRLLATVAPPPKKAPSLRVEVARTTPAGTTTVHLQTVRGPAYLPGEPVITPRTKVTIAPPPTRSLRTNTHLFSA